MLYISLKTVTFGVPESKYPFIIISDRDKGLVLTTEKILLNISYA